MELYTCSETEIVDMIALVAELAWRSGGAVRTLQVLVE